MRRITLLPSLYAVCRLPADAPWPAIRPTGRFASVTATADELSVVVPEEDAPADAQYSLGWRCLKLEGPFDLAETGIMAPLAAALSASGITLLPVGTFDTDYLLVKHETLASAIEALEQAGFSVTVAPSSPG